MGAMVKGPLSGGHIGGLAAPRLQGRILQCPAVGKGQRPGQTRHPGHCVQVGGCGLVALSAREEHDPREGGRHRPPEATKRFLGNALEESGWNVMEVARRLDLARSHVYTLIRAFGLTRTGTR